LGGFLLTIGLQGYAMIKNGAKKNPAEVFQRDVQKNQGCKKSIS